MPGMQTLYPVLKYEDARAAIAFLERAFGFETMRPTTARTAASRTQSWSSVTST